jgi:DNA-binding MarR family transcriptional regulator
MRVTHRPLEEVRVDSDRELADRLHRRLRDIVLLLRQVGAGQPVTSQQAAVLGSLEHGARRMSALAAEHGVRLPTMTAQINRLERDGLVTRGQEPSDARVVTAALTPLGRARLLDARDRRVTFLAGRIAALDPEDRAALVAALPALDVLFTPQERPTP